MALVGMNVSVAEDVLSRLQRSSARARLQEDSSELQAMIYKSMNPAFYGMGPGDGRVLSPYSITLAQNARAAIQRALEGVERGISTLRAEIDGQGVASVAGAHRDVAWNVIDQFLPYPQIRFARQYLVGGRYTYGSVVRNARDPRRNMPSRIVLTQRGPFNSTSWVTRLADRWGTTWVGTVKRAGEELVESVQQGAAAWSHRLPGAVGGSLRVVARAAGPAGILIGGFFAFQEGRADQLRRDEGSGYTHDEMELRANQRGAISAVSTAVGAAAGAALGAAVGGPVGAILGGMLGGWLGEMAGDAIADAVLE